MKTESASSRSHLTARVCIALLLCVAVFTAFSPALSAEFVAWDDDRNFVLNRAYRGLEFANLRWMFTTFHMGHYQPLSWLTLGVDHALWGMDARGYHATNLFFHALTTVAVFELARRLLAFTRESSATDRLVASALTAIVFGLHPLRVESVAWVTERRDVLAGLFFVSTVAAWLRYAATAQRTAYWTAFALVLLSLLAKAAAIVMPAVLLTLDVWPLGRTRLGWKRLLVEKVPFVCASVVFGWLAIRAQAAQGTTLLALSEHGVSERALQAGFGTAFYVWRTLVPLNLIPIHEIPEHLNVWTARFVVPTVLVVVITLSLLALRRRVPALLTAWIVYLIILAPVSGITQAGPQLVADRYSYFACLPFALIGGAVAQTILNGDRGRRLLVAGATCILAVLLGTLTAAQTAHWHDSETLWRRTLAVAPMSANGNLNLGSVLMRRGASTADTAERERLLGAAQVHFERCLAVRAEPQAHVNLGLVALFRAQQSPLEKERLAREAVDQIQAGLNLGESRGSVKPDWRLALGSALLTAGRCDEAVSVLQSVLPSMPDTEAALRSMSLAYACVGRHAEALDVLERALALQPDDATLWLRAGELNSKLGRSHEARVSYENVLALKSAALGTRAEHDEEWKSARLALEGLK
ncbi:MAG: tetratricopeptide repeat protein [Planctomycetes bacterium]|nr:tetratricopeptide repeat protein [Planctomycetota bacterium]